MSEFEKSLEQSKKWNVTIPIWNKTKEGLEQITLYKGTIYEEDDDGFWGEIADKSGCVSQGDNFLDCFKNMKEALKGVLEVERDRETDTKEFPEA